MKILIVDDSELIRERLISLLKGTKEFEIVGQSKNAEEAIDFVNQNEIDIVILDIRLPDKNGLQVLEMIKKTKPETKVIMLTNYPFPQYMKKSEELGADFFIHKVSEFNRVSQIFKNLKEEIV